LQIEFYFLIKAYKDAGKIKKSNKDINCLVFT
jgi:hypothetical protein